MNTKVSTLKAASHKWNKEALKAKDIERRKVRKDARGKQWQIVL